MKRIWILSIALLFGTATILVAQNKKVPLKVAPKSIVEVMYFHGKQRCATCIAIEKYTKEVLAKDFAVQMKNGTVRFKEIDISTPQGEKIADNYRVTWSSLFINQWKGRKEVRNDMTRFSFENARSNTPAFKSGIKGKILQLLK